MNAFVAGIGAGHPAQLRAREPAPPRREPAGPSPAVSLPAPEDQAFKVSTINQRLASLAARRKAGVDFTV